MKLTRHQRHQAAAAKLKARIVRLRELDLTQEAIAAKVGVTRQRVQQILKQATGA